ncbi:MAG TPA: helix-turn-helix domain-containing protein [Syntrophales bacterium]|nr:MAG: hypothetical protein A2052_03760 [Deltaproteobacteria bacterium GWA2_54_12]HLE17578.1 helix-turn-helix domain-containing protein [Syntrophales bacterium]
MRIDLDQEDIQAIAAQVTAEVLKAIKPIVGKGQPTEDTLMTVDECAVYLRVKPQWLYKRTQLKEIPYVKLGRFVMFKKIEVDQWVDREGKMPQLNSSKVFNK